jgi:hypothetical protein
LFEHVSSLHMHCTVASTRSLLSHRLPPTFSKRGNKCMSNPTMIMFHKAKND